MKIARHDEANFDRWAQDQLRSLRPWLRGRRVWWVAAALAVAAGAALNWGWLVAIGAAPLLVAALPCVAMCALGLCMNRMMGRSCSKEATTRKGSGSAPIALAPGLTNIGPAVSQATAADPANKAVVGANSMGRGA